MTKLGRYAKRYKKFLALAANSSNAKLSSTVSSKTQDHILLFHDGIPKKSKVKISPKNSITQKLTAKYTENVTKTLTENQVR